MKIIAFFFFLLCSYMGWAQVPEDLKPTCLTVKDKDCQAAPPVCKGKSSCSDYSWNNVLDYVPLIGGGYWNNNGVFIAKGSGNTCAEAEKDADNRFQFSFKSLCDGKGGPGQECSGGYSLLGFNCYRSGNKLVAWKVCDNRSSKGGRTRKKGGGAVGFLLLNSLKRSEATNGKR